MLFDTIAKSCRMAGRIRTAAAFLALAVLLPAAPAGAGARQYNLSPERDLPRIVSTDESITHLQILGSHNSYRTGPNPAAQKKWGPPRPGGYPELDYGHDSLTHQLEMGLHQLEIDPYADSTGGLYAEDYAYDPAAYQIMRAPGAKVLHIPKFDPRVNCLTLALCLEEIAKWSDEHRNHLMLTILINPQEIGPASRSLALEPMSTASLEEFDATARRIFGARLISPDDIRGDFETLRGAVVAKGWPSIEATRGRVLLVLDTGPVLSDLYRQGHTSLRGRALFSFFPDQDAEAAIFNIQDPLREETYIRSLVVQGFLVRTRSDADTFEARDKDYRRLAAAKRSGAQFISTDYYPGHPDPWHFGFQIDLNKRLVRANPVTSNSARLARTKADRQFHLEKVIYLYRHGLRTPLADEMNAAALASASFPAWLAPEGAVLQEGDLTDHGAAALQAMGEWNHQWLMAQGLIDADICAHAARIEIYTNSVARTIASGHALARGLTQTCNLSVHHQPVGTADPLFSPLQAGVAIDEASARKAILGQTGGLDQVIAPYHAELAMLEQALGCSQSSQPSCDLGPMKSVLTFSHGLPNIEGQIRLVSGASQIFLLQYAQGMPMDQVGWGRVDKTMIARLSRLHGILVNSLARPDYLARKIAQPLGKAIVRDIDQPIPAVKFYVGHDGNIAALSARLGAHFKVGGYGFDDPPLGGALKIEILREDKTAKRFVRLSMEAQTPDQLRLGTKLSPENPPYREVIGMEACGMRDDQLCQLDTFKQLLTPRI